MNLIYIGANAKTIKSDNSDSVYKTAIMYLAPADIVSGVNLCANAVRAACKDACLYGSGLAAVYASIPKARIAKTELYRDDRNAFMAKLVKDIAREQRKARLQEYKLAVRLNGTSDILFENEFYNGQTVFQLFPDVLFYDYTKTISKKRIAAIDAIQNYSVTASYSEANLGYAKHIANQDSLNIAVVFPDRKSIPEFYTLANGKRLPVIDGDKSDERYLDPTDQQYVVALVAKGPAKKDTTGFVIRDIYAHENILAIAA